MSDSVGSVTFQTLFTTATTESFIVIVPDIANSAPEHWHSSLEESWLKALHRRGLEQSRILLFEHGIHSSNLFSWPRLLKKAEALLSGLLNLCQTTNTSECPIQFLCIGVGGLVVKEAIQVAHGQRDVFKDVLDLISGIVFVGTPHTKSSAMETWKSVSLMPRLRLPQVAKQSIDAGDAIRLSLLCSRFEEVRFDRPILSAFETLQTSIKGSFRTKRTVIVGKALGVVGAKTETVVAVDSDYLSLCNISVNSKLFREILLHVKRSIASAQWRIFQLQQEGSDRSLIPQDQYTVRTHSVSGIEDLTMQDTSRGTTGSTTASYQIISGISDTITSWKPIQRAVKLPCHLYGHHVRNGNFFGREDVLHRLQEALLPSYGVDDYQGAKTLQTFSLCGLGGVGKTEIAVEFMYANKDHFDAIFWVHADEPTKLREDFGRIAIELGLADSDEAKDQVISANIVKGWLANAVKGPDPADDVASQEATWLLIFDNVDDPESLEDFWPLGKGSILITSRDPFAKNNPYMAMAGIDLTPFSEDDAAKLLMRLTKVGYYETEEQLPPEALAIAHRLGGLALGITQMAGLINRRDYTLGEFLRKYDENSLAKFHTFKDKWQSNSYEHTIASVWALDRVGESSLRILDVLSLLDPDGIKESILTTLVGAIDLSHFPRTEEQYEDARLDLVKRSLVTRNKQTLELRIHRLTQDAIRARMAVPRLRDTFSATILLLSAVWPFATMAQRHQTSRWDECENLLPNIARLQDFYSSFVLPKGLFRSNVSFAKLLVDAAWYLHERGGGAKFAQFLDVAQEVCEAQDEDARLILSDIYYTRGAEAAETNDKSTALTNNTAFLRLRLDISRTSALNTKDAILAQAYNQAANANLDERQFELALEYYGKALEVFKSLPDYSETMTSICVANLATAYWLLGRLDDAYNILMQNLKARESQFGMDDTESFRTGRILHVLGNVTFSQGHLGESFRYHTRALAQYRATVGNKHHRTADLCYKVAEHHLRYGHYLQARMSIEQALLIYTSRDHFKPELARTKHLMGQLFTLTGDMNEASRFNAASLDLLRTLTLSDTRPNDMIETADFDDVVCFASR